MVVMLVVLMLVRVFDRGVKMRVFVTLSQMEPHTDAHQRAGQRNLDRYRFA